MPPATARARQDVSRFIANLRGNFAADAPAWQLIDSPAHRAARRAAIVAAILGYGDERALWRQIVRETRP